MLALMWGGAKTMRHKWKTWVKRRNSTQDNETLKNTERNRNAAYKNWCTAPLYWRKSWVDWWCCRFACICSHSHQWLWTLCSLHRQAREESAVLALRILPREASRHVPLGADTEGESGHAGRLWLLALQGFRILPDVLEEVSRVMEVLPSLLRLLLPWPGPG